MNAHQRRKRRRFLQRWGAYWGRNVAGANAALARLSKSERLRFIRDHMASAPTVHAFRVRRRLAS